MVPWVFNAKPGDLRLIPGDLHGRRRESTPVSHLLTSISPLWHGCTHTWTHACTYVYTHK